MSKKFLINQLLENAVFHKRCSTKLIDLKLNLRLISDTRLLSQSQILNMNGMSLSPILFFHSHSSARLFMDEKILDHTGFLLNVYFTDTELRGDVGKIDLPSAPYRWLIYPPLSLSETLRRSDASTNSQSNSGMSQRRAQPHSFQTWNQILNFSPKNFF